MQVNFEEVAQKKIMELRSLKRLIAMWRMQGKKIVFTNGCFDLLHPGHLHLLNSARSFGNILIVGVNTDSSVRKLKPGRPIQDEQSRALILASLEVIDAVVLFEEETPLALISEILPDVLVKGGDYKIEDVVGKEVVEKNGGRIELVKLLEGFSTSEIIRRTKL